MKKLIPYALASASRSNFRTAKLLSFAFVLLLVVAAVLTINVGGLKTIASKSVPARNSGWIRSLGGARPNQSALSPAALINEVGAVKHGANMLQFTSRGHVLGFEPSGVYVAAGSHALRVEFVNARQVNPSPLPVGEGEGEGVSTSRSVPHSGPLPKGEGGAQVAAPLSKITYANLWPGVTVTYDAPGGGIVRSNYRLEPNANVDNIRLRYNAPVSIDKDGSLRIAFETGIMTESAPRAWQERAGRRVPVQIAFSQRGRNEIAFAVGDHDRSLPLFIDPTLTWNTFLGGSGYDGGNGVAVDGGGNVYVTGFSNATWGSPVRAYISGSDAFVAKLDSSGNLTWNTFLGGSGDDSGNGVAVDGSGNVYVTGYSIATWGSPVRAYTSGNDAFAAKLDSSGALTWNTFLGGSGDDIGNGVAVDGSGNVYVAGLSNAAWVSPVPVRAYSSGYDAFAAKLDSSGTLTWNTFLGGSGFDEGLGVAVDGSGNVYVAGISHANWGSPVRAYTSGYDAFAAKLDSSGALTWNTFLGGSGDDSGNGVAVDGSGNAYVTGYSNADWGSPVLAYNSGYDAFAAKLDSSGTLTWNTFLGGSGDDIGYGVAVDGSGNVYVTGLSNATWGSPVRAHSSGNDAFVAKITQNQPPTITAATGLSRQQGSPSSNSQIATVNDTESGANGVTVTVTSANPSNGVTISNIVNMSGNVTADIVADCSASNASFTLNADDGQGGTATDTLNISVTSNTAPTLTYNSPQSVIAGQSLTVNPATGPSDNGSVSSIILQSQGTYTGTISVDNSTGVVSISNAAPVGAHTITIRATDNCTANTDAQFTLNVNACPTSFTVNDNGDAHDATPGDGSCTTAGAVCTLRAAIEEANALTGCGAIDINFNIGSSTITLGSELAINHSVNVNGPTANSVTISGNNTSRIFNINSGKSLTISFLTIANGKSAQGGGIFNAGTLTITNSTLTGNATPDGTDATGSANGGNSTDGGGIYNTGSLTLINSTISGNKTGRGGNASGTGNGGNSGNGGGVYSTGTLTLTNSTVANNKNGIPGQPVGGNTTGSIGTSGLGGGIFQSGGTLTLNNTIVATNTDGFGDADDLNGTATSSNFNLIGSDANLSGISDGTNGNQVGTAAIPLSPHLGALADNGGPTQTQLPDQFSPVIDAGSNAFITNPPFSGPPFTDQRGTGFPRRIDGGKGKPDEPTVDIGAVEAPASTAPPGADLTVTKSVDRDTVVPDRDLTYTIIATNNGADAATNASLTDQLPLVTDNTDPDNPHFIGTTFVSFTAPAGWSCSAPPVGSTGTFSCNRASFAGVSQQTFTLVVHVPPSAMRNEGDPFISNIVTVSAANETNTENNEGFADTQLFSCFIDPVVTRNTDSGAGTLRDAIADACVGSTITFDMTHFASPITLTTGELLINKNLTINGPGANQLTISGNNASRVFEIQSGKTVTISSLTIASGKVTVGPLQNIGGGVLNAGTLTITNSTLSGNSLSGSDNSGGGIYNDGSGILTITNSTLSSNSASGSTSSVSNGGGIFNLGTVTLTNSTLSGNSVSGGNGSGDFGGGILNGGTLTITNSTLSGNSASGGTNNQGGGVYNNGPLTITNSTLSNNSVSGGSNFNQGGGIFNVSTVNPKNTIIAGNAATTGPDLNGTFNSQDYNLIGNTSGATFTGTTTHNIINQSANLGVLANNGGPTQTMLPLPGSPAINAGDNCVFDNSCSPALPAALTTDQRGTGFSRKIGGTVDIGAVEVNYAVTATAGTPQSATINSAFGTLLKATVTESGNAQNGVAVTFTPPASGASGTFVSSATVNTNSSGVATAPSFTANGIAGSYNVVASIGIGLPTALFALTNNPAGTTTAVSSGANPSNLNQNVTFTATVTSTAGAPIGTVTFKDGGSAITCSNAGGQTLNGSGVATCQTSSLTAGVHTITAVYNGDGNFLTSTGTLSGGQQVGSIVRFSASNYNTTESSGFTTITIQRIGDLSAAVSVDYSTPDDSSAMTVLPCSTANGAASPRCDFEAALGTLRWAAGDGADKTFTILINQDNFVEGPETATPLTLSNLTGGAGFNPAGATNTTATLTIADDAIEPAGNAIDDTDTFVRQHYRDFLNRDPRDTDPKGLKFWKDNIDKCNDPAQRPAGLTQAQCIEVFRINTSAAFFLSIEYQNTGYFVERTYKAGFGDISPPTVPVPVRFTNFLRDTQAVGAGVIVGQGSWQTQLDTNKSAFALDFVQRPAFLTRYPGSTTATALVDSLNTNAGNVLTSSERSALINELTPNPSDPALRADVLRKVADNATLQQNEFNRAFVLMQYFGYLRRNPDAAPEPKLNFDGYNFWLNKLNSFNGDFVKAEMVKAFIFSSEYRQRFGP